VAKTSVSHPNNCFLIICRDTPPHDEPVEPRIYLIM
jgi:hypothetical protein